MSLAYVVWRVWSCESDALQLKNCFGMCWHSGGVWAVGARRGQKSVACLVASVYVYLLCDINKNAFVSVASIFLGVECQIDWQNKSTKCQMKCKQLWEFDSQIACLDLEFMSDTWLILGCQLAEALEVKHKLALRSCSGSIIFEHGRGSSGCYHGTIMGLLITDCALLVHIWYTNMYKYKSYYCLWNSLHQICYVTAFR